VPSCARTLIALPPMQGVVPLPEVGPRPLVRPPPGGPPAWQHPACRRIVHCPALPAKPPRRRGVDRKNWQLASGSSALQRRRSSRGRQGHARAQPGEDVSPARMVRRVASPAAWPPSCCRQTGSGCTYWRPWWTDSSRRSQRSSWRRSGSTKSASVRHRQTDSGSATVSCSQRTAPVVI
jgi:hypothetical protein